MKNEKNNKLQISNYSIFPLAPVLRGEGQGEGEGLPMNTQCTKGNTKEPGTERSAVPGQTTCKTNTTRGLREYAPSPAL